MRLRKHPAAPSAERTTANDPSAGSLQSLTEMAGWVRFADTKATILAAGLGVSATIVLSGAARISAAMRLSWLGLAIVGTLALGSLVCLIVTLYWIVRAISPRSDVAHPSVNRFAWPSLTNATADQLIAHARAVPLEDDAWQQVIDLAKIADLKFRACRAAVKAFAALLVLGVACVVTAAALVG